MDISSLVFIIELVLFNIKTLFFTIFTIARVSNAYKETLASAKQVTQVCFITCVIFYRNNGTQ